MIVTDQPVGRHKPSARLQHAEDIPHQRVLVGNVNDRILAEDNIEGAGRKRQWTRHHLDDTNHLAEPCLRGAVACIGKNGVLDIDAADVARAELLHQQHVDAARTAADVENRFALQVHSVEQAAHFVGSAGGKPAVAPQALKNADHAVMIKFAVFCVAHVFLASKHFRKHR